MEEQKQPKQRFFGQATMPTGSDLVNGQLDKGGFGSVLSRVLEGQNKQRELDDRTEADSRIQRHQENEMRQLEVEKGKYGLGQAVKYGGHPKAEQYFEQIGKLLSEPGTYTAQFDKAGKPTGYAMRPEVKKHIDSIYALMQPDFSQQSQEQPGQVAQVAGAQAPTPTNTGSAFGAFAKHAAGPAATGGLIAAAAKAPGAWKLATIPAALAAGSMFSSALNNVNPAETEAHPTASAVGDWAGLAGSVIGGGAAFGRQLKGAKGTGMMEKFRNLRNGEPAVASPVTPAPQATQTIAPQAQPGAGRSFSQALPEPIPQLSATRGATPQPKAGSFPGLGRNAGVVEGSVQHQMKALGFTDQQIAQMTPQQMETILRLGLRP